MFHISSQRLLSISEVSDLYSTIDLALIDEQGRKVDLFGRVAACFICRGETSSGRGNVELLHPDGGRGPFSGQATKTGRKTERAEAATDEFAAGSDTLVFGEVILLTTALLERSSPRPVSHTLHGNRCLLVSRERNYEDSG